MKLFTVAEANALLADIAPKLLLIQRLYTRVEALRQEARAAAAASDFGGGMLGGTGYVNTLYAIGKLTTELQETGVEIKDYTRGLVDFPSMRGERIIFLCWQPGDGDEVSWWHETDAGFAGRQRL